MILAWARQFGWSLQQIKLSFQLKPCLAFQDFVEKYAKCPKNNMSAGPARTLLISTDVVPAILFGAMWSILFEKG